MSAAGTPAGWDTHVHVFDAAAPVRPGHYQPAHSPLGAIERLAAGHGIGHLVLVQPSVYGTDNSVMLQALEAAGGRHRGVAVVAPGIGEAELDRLHAAGVRGIRFNLVSPAGQSGDGGGVEDALRQLAPRLRARGWHVQWYVPADALPRLVGWQASSGLRFVLDHLAGLGTGVPDHHPAWAAAQALADGGAWIKLSGWYRLGSTAPHADLQTRIRRAAELFGHHMVWGSDWPHTSVPPACRPPYASMLAPLGDACDTAARDAVLHTQAALLYT